MAIDLTTAKTLLTAAEFKLCEMAQSAQIAKLSERELNDAVKRSRTMRDKWRDVSRTQRRSTQTAQGSRRTDANARSDEKAALLAEVHQAFVDRQNSLREGGSPVAASGPKPVDVPKKDRKIVTRAVRSIVKGELKRTKISINRVKGGRTTAQTTAGDSPKESAASSKSSGTAKAVAQKKKPIASRATKKAVKPKAPVVSKSRKKQLAKRAEISASKPASTSAGKPKTATAASTKGLPGKAALVSSNRSLSAKATQARLARGGGKRVQGHVSAVGKRSQARRDGKN